MNRTNPFKLSIEDVRGVELMFYNGESIFISNKHLNKFDINLNGTFKVIDDPIFEYGYVFSTGTIYIDKMYLHQVLGDDILNKLIYRGDITSLKVGFYNDFKIKSNIPLLLCQFKIKATSNYITKMKYEEDDDNLIIRWIPVDAL